MGLQSGSPHEMRMFLASLALRSSSTALAGRPSAGSLEMTRPSRLMVPAILDLQDRQHMACPVLVLLPVMPCHVVRVVLHSANAAGSSKHEAQGLQVLQPAGLHTTEWVWRCACPEHHALIDK